MTPITTPRTSITRFAALALAVALAAPACTRYEQRPLAIRLPSSYPNAVSAFGATVAAHPLDDAAKAKEAFGFDIVGAGVLPVQVIFDHQGNDPIEIVAAQTYLVDDQGQLWNVLDQAMAYNRLEKSTEWGQIMPEAGKGAVLGAAAGAIVGAAIGIVTGGRIGETVGKGAAVGGAGGAVLGGAKGHQDPDVRRSIRDDLKNRSLGNKPVPPQALSHGVLFFPAEAAKAKQLRLQLRSSVSGQVQTFTMAL
ncbi:MAG: hypothetical protein ACYDA8_09955 [Deferrisomatales bacterium]